MGCVARDLGESESLREMGRAAWDLGAGVCELEPRVFCS